MTMYEALINAYQSGADRGKISRFKAKKHIRIYEFLNSCDEQDLGIVIDAGGYNNIIKGYMLAALDNTEVTEDIKRLAMNNLIDLFVDMSADEAANYYKKKWQQDSPAEQRPFLRRE